MAKKPTNFRGIYAPPPEKMTEAQLRAYIEHEYGEGKKAESMTRKQMLEFIHQQEELDWVDYREKLINEENAQTNKGKEKPPIEPANL